jgi:caa(3)-type oxidase subunit IV
LFPDWDDKAKRRRGAGEALMADAHAPGAHAGPNVKLYLVIGGALAVFTVVSFVVNAMYRGGTITAQTGFVIILGVAVCKAVLVAMFYMHLKYDWGRVYFMVVPVLILGTMFMVVLLPDIVLAWHTTDKPGTEQVEPAP